MENLSNLAGVGLNLAEEASGLSPDNKPEGEIKELRSLKAEVAVASIGRFLPAMNVGAKALICAERRLADTGEI